MNNLTLSSKRFKLLLILLLFSTTIITPCYFFNVIDIASTNYFNNNNELKSGGYWDLTGTPILIDDTNPSQNWSYTATNYDWCSGSGTWGDPYLIENVTVNGQATDRCLTVRNSNVFFVIHDCILFNSKDDNLYGGIFLENVNNGAIKKNNCSNNGRSGMWLENCNNITITGNTLNDNGDSGICIRSSFRVNISLNNIDNCPFSR